MVEWHFCFITLAYAFLGLALIALCLALNYSSAGPLSKRTSNKIIDAGYWTGLPLLLCWFYFGSPSPAQASLSPAPLPAAAQEAPTSSPAQVLYPKGYKGPDVYGASQHK